MAVISEQPHRNSNFLVDFGRGDSGSVLAGFAEVVFPTFHAAQAQGRQPQQMVAQTVGHTEAAAANHLVLKRGATGSLDLYAWWDKARRGETPGRRTVKVQLLGEDQATVVLTWRFSNVRPLSLSYSPLNAMDGGVLMETLVLEFDRMEMG